MRLLKLFFLSSSSRRRFLLRFRSRLLILILILIVASLISISSLGSREPRQVRLDDDDQKPNRFANHQRYFELLRQKYPSKKSESSCQTDLLLESNEQTHDDQSSRHPDCERDSPEWVRFDRFGRMSFDRDALNRSGVRSVKLCEYADVKWPGSDYAFDMTEFVRIDEGQRVRNGTEFFQVRCKSDANQFYRGAFARLFDDET